MAQARIAIYPKSAPVGEWRGREDRTEPKSDWKKEVEGEGRGNEKAEKKKGKTIPNCSFWSLEEEKGLRTTYKNKLPNGASCRMRHASGAFPPSSENFR
jgi:hypothetical protein